MQAGQYRDALVAQQFEMQGIRKPSQQDPAKATPCRRKGLWVARQLFFGRCDHAQKIATQTVGFLFVPIKLETAVDRLGCLIKPHEIEFFTFDHVHLLGESATHPMALRLPRHSALFRLAGSSPLRCHAFSGTPITAPSGASNCGF